MVSRQSRFALLCSVALAWSPAFAADLRGTFPTEPPPPYAPVFSWTGFYVGAHGGYAFLSDDSITQNTVTSGASKLHRHGDSAMGGGQVGYNYQVPGSGVVLGLAGDVSGLDLTAKGPLNLTASGTQDFQTNKTDIDVLATVRGRLGYAFDSALVYVTGGLAIRDGEQTRTQYFTPTFDIPFSSKPYYVDKVRNTSVGYAVGGGIEYTFAAHWSVEADYQYLHFEGIEATFPHALAVVEKPEVFQPRRYVSNEDLHLAKVGVNNHF